MVYHLDQRYYRIHLDLSSSCSTPVDFQVDPNLDNSSTRMLVENTFARLKNRFATLRNKVNFKTDELICKAIVACMVIHNLCILLNDEVLVQEMELDIHNDPVPVFNEQVFGQEPRPKSKRGRITQSLFTKLRQNADLFARR